MRPILPVSAAILALSISGLAAASPPAMSCSDEQTLSEEVAGSDLVVVGELAAVRKTMNGTMVTVEADVRVSQTLYSAPGAKTAPTLTVTFQCDSAPIPHNVDGYPTVASYCNEAGMPRTMPPQVSVLTLKTVDHKLRLVKRFVWGPCVDLAELKKKSPHVASVVAKIQATKLPAPTSSAPPMPTTPASTTSTPLPPANTLAPAATVTAMATATAAATAATPSVPAKSSGCTVQPSAGGRSGAFAALAAGLVLIGAARKKPSVDSGA